MIETTAPISPVQVAEHYDDLDRFYREVWGVHVHHGLYESRRDTSEIATRRLTDFVAKIARIEAGDRVCDVGCGYGGTARVLARELGAEVVGLTVSAAQHAFAEAVEPGFSNPSYLLRDWLHNGLESASFDALIAIESTEHMASLDTFFAEAARVLRPGGRLVVCAWLTRLRPSRWERRALIEPICREGQMRGMGTADDYLALARQHGFEQAECRDVTAQVKRTWTVCARRVALGLIRDPSYREFLLRGPSHHKVFALTLLRILVAYRIGTMRYGILNARKASAQDGRSHCDFSIPLDAIMGRDLSGSVAPNRVTF